MNSGANILVYINLGSWFFNIIAAKEGSLVDISWYNYHFYWLLNCKFFLQVFWRSFLWSMFRTCRLELPFSNGRIISGSNILRPLGEKKIPGIPSLFLFLVCSLTSQNSAILKYDAHDYC